MAILNTKEIRTVFSADDRTSQAVGNFNKNLKAIERQSTDSAMSIKRAWEVASGAAMAFVGLNIVQKVGQLAQSTIKAAQDQEIAQQRLTTALGRYSDELVRNASEMAKRSTYEDDAIMAAQARIAMYTRDEQQIKTLTRLTMDYAAATGKDLEDAATQVGRTFATNANVMKRAGVEVTGLAGSQARLQSITKGLTETFGGQDEALRGTYFGAVKGITNQWQQYKQELGAIITQNPAVLTALSEINNLLADQGGEISNVREALQGYVKGGLVVAITAMNTFNFAVDTGRHVLYAIATLIMYVNTSIWKMAEGITYVASGFGTLEGPWKKAYEWTKGMAVGAQDWQNNVVKNWMTGYEKNQQVMVALDDIKQKIMGVDMAAKSTKASVSGLIKGDRDYTAGEAEMNKAAAAEKWLADQTAKYTLDAYEYRKAKIRAEYAEHAKYVKDKEALERALSLALWDIDQERLKKEQEIAHKRRMLEIEYAEDRTDAAMKALDTSLTTMKKQWDDDFQYAQKRFDIEKTLTGDISALRMSAADKERLALKQKYDEVARFNAEMKRLNNINYVEETLLNQWFAGEMTAIDRKQQTDRAMQWSEYFAAERDQANRHYAALWNLVMEGNNLMGGETGKWFGAMMAGFKGQSDITQGADPYTLEINRLMDVGHQKIALMEAQWLEREAYLRRTNTAEEQIAREHQQVISEITAAGGTYDLQTTALVLQQKYAMYQNSANIVMGIMGAMASFAGENNKALFLVQKAAAIATTIISAHSAAAAAVAPPPIGLGPVMGIPLAGKMLAFGYLQAALIAATAIQGMTSGSGSAPSAGGYSYTEPTTNTWQTTSTEKVAAAPTIQIHIYGNVVDQDKFARELVPALQRAWADNAH